MEEAEGMAEEIRMENWERVGRGNEYSVDLKKEGVETSGCKKAERSPRMRMGRASLGFGNRIIRRLC